MATEETAAVVTIKRAGEMTVDGRKSIAGWLRKQADFLEEAGDQYANRFRASYRYLTDQEAP